MCLGAPEQDGTKQFVGIVFVILENGNRGEWGVICLPLGANIAHDATEVIHTSGLKSRMFENSAVNPGRLAATNEPHYYNNNNNNSD